MVVTNIIMALLLLAVTVFGGDGGCTLSTEDVHEMQRITSTMKLLFMEAAVSGDSSALDEFIGLHFLYDFSFESHFGVTWDSLDEYLDPSTGVIPTVRSFGTLNTAIINSGENVVASCHWDENGRRIARVTFPMRSVYAYAEHTAEIDELRSVTWIEADPHGWRAVSSTLDQFTSQTSIHGSA